MREKVMWSLMTMELAHLLWTPPSNLFYASEENKFLPSLKAARVLRCSVYAEQAYSSFTNQDMFLRLRRTESESLAALPTTSSRLFFLSLPFLLSFRVCTGADARGWLCETGSPLGAVPLPSRGFQDSDSSHQISRASSCPCLSSSLVPLDFFFGSDSLDTVSSCVSQTCLKLAV